MIDPHVKWLRDQILERIRAAKSVKQVGGAWHAQEPDTDGPADVDDDLDRVVTSAADSAIANYIAMNDPATVAAICLAELDILAGHRSSGVFASASRGRGALSA